MTSIALIVAVAKNGVIGAGNTIPWHCPADLQYFKRTTMGAPVLMGRKTYLSLKIKPLPGRKNIVVTRDQSFSSEVCDVANSVEEGLQLAGSAEKVFVIGGEEIYRQVLSQADELYITYVDVAVEGDRYFPSLDLNDWRLVREEKHPADSKNLHDLHFKVFTRDT